MRQDNGGDDHARFLDATSRVSDFFKGVRPLSAGQMKALRDRSGVPVDLLLA